MKNPSEIELKISWDLMKYENTWTNSDTLDNSWGLCLRRHLCPQFFSFSFSLIVILSLHKKFLSWFTIFQKILWQSTCATEICLLFKLLSAISFMSVSKYFDYYAWGYISLGFIWTIWINLIVYWAVMYTMS